MRIILASGSPRRKQLLAQVGIPCEVIVSGVNEDVDDCTPEDHVQELALRKAEAVRLMVAYEEEPAVVEEAIIIGADTLVYVGGEVLGKPTTREDAFAMLKMLQGRCHTVYTGVSVLHEDVTTFVSSANVYFHDLSDEEIWGYINTGEPFDKAGAYGVQEKGALLVDRIDGDYYTGMGLPIAKLAAVLSEIGVNIWS